MFRAYQLRKHHKIRFNKSTLSVSKRHLGYVEKYDDIRPGDILLFRPLKELTVGHYILMLLQSLLDQPHGHFDTTHAAICVDKNDQGKAIIAHINVYGWQKEPLANMFQRNGGDRAFIVFRHNVPYVAHAIAKTAAAKENADIEWKYSAAVSSLFCEAMYPNADKEIARDSYCSKFVVQVMQTTIQQLDSEYQKYMPYLESSPTPKALEAYLFNDRHYEMLVHCGDTNPYDLIMQHVASQITRLNNKADKESTEKARVLQNRQDAIAERLRTMDDLTPIDQTIFLLKNIKNELMIETSYNPRSTTTSHREIMQQAREIGIFQRDVDADELIEIPQNT